MKMNSDYSPRSEGRRPRRRSGGRNSNGASRSRGGERRENSYAPAPVKKSFLDRLKGLFGLGSKKAARPSARPEAAERSLHPTVRRAEEQRGARSERPARERSERPARVRPELEAANPDAVIVPRLYVGNLSYDTAESDLFDLFSKVGSVRNVELVMDHRNNRSKGFGFVEMQDLEIAKKAVVDLHRTEFMGRQIVVSGAKSERRPDTAPAPEVPPTE